MILVTGASGQLGRAVITRLLKAATGQKVAALVRCAKTAAELWQAGVKIHVGHYDDLASLDTAMQGVEKHLLISGTDEQNRVQQHQNVIDAAKRAKVSFIGYTSRAVKNQDSSANSLMEGHFQTEDAVKKSALNYAIFRNALYMDVIPLFVGGEKVFDNGIKICTGNGKVSFALRSELGEAIANVLMQAPTNNRIYHLAPACRWSFYDVAQALTEISGKPVAYNPVAREEFEKQMLARGLPQQMVKRSADFLCEIEAGFLDDVSDELEQVLGRQPSSLKSGLGILFKT